MKRFFSIFLFCLGAAIAGSELQLSSPRAIKVDDPEDPVQIFAAQELQRHLKMISGIEHPVGETEPATFVIGRKAPSDMERMNTGEGRYTFENNVLYFYGEDYYDRKRSLDKILADRDNRTGTLNSVYTFLDQECGVRWTASGNDRIVFIPRNSVVLKEKKVNKWRLPLEFAFVRPYFWNPKLIAGNNKRVPEELRFSSSEVYRKRLEHIVWTRRMRLGANEIIRFGHAFTDYQDRFLKTHPEYLGMNQDGSRGLPDQLKNRVKLCVSNEAVVDQIISDWQANGAKKYLNVCPNDGTPGFCRCPRCLALDERRENERFLDHLTDRYVNFWNRIAAKAVKIRPDVTLVTYAYSYYRFAPRREKIQYPENILLGLVPMLMEDNRRIMEEWRKAGVRHFFLRPNDLCYEAVYFRGFERGIWEQFSAARDIGLNGMDFDACIGNPVTELDFYIAARAMAKPQMSFEEIEKEYLSIYGAAAPAVKKFYELYRRNGDKMMRKVYRKLKQEKRYLLDSGQIPIVIQEKINFYYPVSLMREASALLEETLQYASELNESERRHLARLKSLNDHSIMTFELVEALNRKAADIEEKRNKLLKYRIQHKDLGFCWPLLFTRPRAEGNLKIR